MADKALLIFVHHGLYYAIDALGVREIIPLPELTPVEESPPYVAGVVDFRGKIMPIIDLDLFFGHEGQRYFLTDFVIVLEAEGVVKGIIVNEVKNMKSVREEDIQPVANDEGTKGSKNFVTAEAMIGEDVAMVLDYVNLIKYSRKRKGKAKAPAFCPEATPEEREVFHQRSLNLMQPPERIVMEGLVPLAVFSLGGEYFGTGLEFVREFTTLRNVVPVPCTPSHIVGNMNLRGDILTLVDIRSILKIAESSPSKDAKAIVAQIDELLAGVPVDEVFEVIYLQEDKIKPVPAAIEPISDEFIKGTFPYGGKMLSILDLQKIVTREDLIVNEEV